ncbi:choline O-acetyltransferase-like [Colias croceus]|uniref:choline O-acetyltransferase-like n=1 Tax=Colias crocea TaxID=72248 RepID=UPI001E27E58D|nr:choline O-acetyltransferase-like [Colias croceus]
MRFVLDGSGAATAQRRPRAFAVPVRIIAAPSDLYEKIGSSVRRWGESLLSFPKKWLSTQMSGAEDDEFQCVQVAKLPVPELQATIDTYLDFASVIVSPQQMETTRDLAKKFIEDVGPKLQNILLQRQKDKINWVTDWWLEDMYLKIRLPLPINSSPGMVFPRRQFAKIDEVADLAALYIDDLLDYKEMLDRDELPQERATSREKGQPLCMEQFYRLLGVSREPGLGKDRLSLPVPPADPDNCEELVIVACKNYYYSSYSTPQFYAIPVKASDRGRLTAGEIQGQLLHAMVDAADAPPAPRVGLLTAMNRDDWAKARELLAKDETNRSNLDLLTRALCVVCIDESGGDRADCDADTNALLRAMHGAGTKYHSANRWFDKTVQLIISSDGTVGMCYEHSPAEGVAVVRLAERALARAAVSPRPAPPPALLPAPARLAWNLTPEINKCIDKAARDLDR